MGYQNPNVVKEVYLPFLDGEIEIKEYKRITGIDLYDFIQIKKTGENTFEVSLKQKNFKLYFVLNDFPATESGNLITGIIPAVITINNDVLYIRASLVYDGDNLSNEFDINLELSNDENHLIMFENYAISTSEL